MGTVKVKINGVKTEINMDEKLFMTVDEMNKLLLELKKKWPKAKTQIALNITPLPDGRRVYLVYLTFDSAPRFLGDYR